LFQQQGRQAGRRIVLALGQSPATGTALRLTLPAGALEDDFLNANSAEVQPTWTWSGADEVVLDTRAPAISEVRIRSGRVEIELTEEVVAASAAATVTIDGAPTTWQLAEDRYTLRSLAEVSPGGHTVSLVPGIADLAGRSQLEQLDVTFAPGLSGHAGYRRPDPTVIPTSSAANAYGFHGHEVDPATGLVYMRNRWYDPQMGRFVTADPLGYVDGPSAYQFAGFDPVSQLDPFGLYEEDVHRHLTTFLAMKAGFSREMAELIGQETQALDLDYRDAMFGGGANNFNMAIYHFVSPGRLLQMRRDAFSGGYLSSGQLQLVGEFLHAWEDSYSHQSDTSSRDFGDQFHDEHPLPFNDQDIGHGRHKHKPDWTWDRPGLALRMAKSTFSLLVKLCAAYRSQCPGIAEDFSTFESIVVNFISFKPQIYQDEFVAGPFRIVVPDVASYEEKVRLLGGTFTTQGMEESESRASSFSAAEERRRKRVEAQREKVLGYR